MELFKKKCTHNYNIEIRIIMYLVNCLKILQYFYINM